LQQKRTQKDYSSDQSHKTYNFNYYASLLSFLALPHDQKEPYKTISLTSGNPKVTLFYLCQFPVLAYLFAFA
jgi:hypothetical protein